MSRILTSVEDFEHRLKPSEMPKKRKSTAGSKVHIKVQSQKGLQLSFLKQLMPSVSNHFYARPIPKVNSFKSARRCTIKVHFSNNKSDGNWSAHGKYLEREGVQEEKGIKPSGFNSVDNDISISEMVNLWQKENDPYIFKVMISPEDFLNKSQLVDFTRQFNERIQKTIHREYDWVAITHHNTEHPHAHLLIRCKGNLKLSPDLIRSGMRNISSEILTEKMGYRTEKEIQLGFEKETQGIKITSIDKFIEKELQIKNGNLILDLSDTFQNNPYLQEKRRLKQKRIKKLMELQLVKKTDNNHYIFDKTWIKLLKEMQNLQTRTKIISDAREIMTDTRILPAKTTINKGDHIIGRVIGKSIDDNSGFCSILLEAVDGKAHIISETPAIARARAKGELKNKNLIAITGLEKGVAVKDYGVQIDNTNWKKFDFPYECLEDARKNNYQPKKIDAGFGVVFNAKFTEFSERQKNKEKSKGKNNEI